MKMSVMKARALAEALNAAADKAMSIGDFEFEFPAEQQLRSADERLVVAELRRVVEAAQDVG